MRRALAQLNLALEYIGEGHNPGVDVHSMPMKTVYLAGMLPDSHDPAIERGRRWL